MSGNAIPAMQVYHYEECPDASVSVWAGFGESEAETISPGKPPADRTTLPYTEEQIAEEVRKSFEAGRVHGVQEGRQAERDALATARAAEETRRREQVVQAMQRVAEDHERYLHAIEHEVVALALAVAARILRREAQMDPLLLTGAVRVALGQLSGATEAHLRVPPAELEMWQEAIAHLPNLAFKPVVEPGEGMLTGDCVIETTVGSVDLGIRAQLSELERGFFDRAGGRVVENSPRPYPASEVRA